MARAGKSITVFTATITTSQSFTVLSVNFLHHSVTKERFTVCISKHKSSYVVMYAVSDLAILIHLADIFLNSVCERHAI
jgi:hypothetical protein